MFPGSEIGLAESCEVASGLTVDSRPATEVPAPRGGRPGVAVWSVKSPRMNSTFGLSSMFARAVLAVYRSSRELGESGVWAPAMLVLKTYLSAMLMSRKRWEERLHWSKDWRGGSLEEGWIQAWISGRQLQSPTNRSRAPEEKKTAKYEMEVRARTVGRWGGGVPRF